MADYPLNNLSAREFEHVIQDIACIHVAKGITFYGDGPDGGREAIFEGRMDYPSINDAWDGYLILQCKHKIRPFSDHRDASWLASQLEGEMKKFEDPIRDLRMPEYYILASNVSLSAYPESGGKDKLNRMMKEYCKKFGIKGFHVWDFNHICRLLDQYPNIARSYSALLTPSHVLSEHLRGEEQNHQYLATILETVQSLKSNETAVKELNELSNTVSGDTADFVEILKDNWLSGKREEVLEKLVELRGNEARSRSLSDDARARLLRFESSIRLWLTDDMDLVQELADIAKKIAPEHDDTKLRAMMVLQREGIDSALNVLSNSVATECKNLAVQLYIVKGDFEQAKKSMESIELSFRDSETLCNRAYVSLTHNDIEMAAIYVMGASKLHPDWLMVRQCDAITHFFSALVSTAVTLNPLGILGPFDEIVIKEDIESKEHLKAADEIFKLLAERNNIATEERNLFISWRIPCLIALQNINDAREECMKILDVDPVDLRALLWAVISNWDMDFVRSRDGLLDIIRRQKAEIPHFVCLLYMLIREDNQQLALDILEANRKAFDEKRASATWYAWKCNVLNSEGDLAGIKELYDELSTEDRDDEFQYLKSEIASQLRGDRETIFTYFDDFWAKKGDPIALFLACRIRESEGDWEYIASNIDNLILRIPTARMIRYCAMSAYNGKRPERSISLLDENINLFENSCLPEDMVRLKVYAYGRMGAFSEAMHSAYDLVKLNATTANKLLHFRACWWAADIDRSVIAARDLKSAKDVEPLDLLQIASMIDSGDRQLSIELCRIAESKGIPDNGVLLAQTLAYRQGRDEEAGQLLARIKELADKGEMGVFQFGEDELESILESAKERFQQTNTLYQSGSIPSHLVAEHLNVPLVYLYHILPNQNASNGHPLSDPLLLFRHGAKTDLLPSACEQYNLSIYIDITSLLLAYHLDILELVIHEWGPVHIPAVSIPALIEMRAKLEPHQKTQYDSAEHITKLIETNKIRVETVTHEDPHDLKDLIGCSRAFQLEFASSQCIKVLDFLPITKLFSSEMLKLPQKYDETLVNIRKVLETLKENGYLDKVEYEKARRLLFTYGSEDQIGMDIAKDSRILTSPTILAVLERAQILEVFVECFEVAIPKWDADRLKKEYAGSRQQIETIDWLDSLISLIRNGLESKRILTFTGDENQGGIEEEHRESAMHQCLHAISTTEVSKNGVLWVDDRFISGFRSGKDNIPIATTYEILTRLRQNESISDETYYEKLLLLRKSNIRFIPLTHEEVIYHLSQAGVANEVLTETPALRTLRTSFSAIFSRADILQKPVIRPEEKPNLGELKFAVNLATTFESSILEAWKFDYSQGHQDYPRAEWILRSLYVDFQGSAKTSGAINEGNISDFKSASLAYLLYQGLGLLDLVNKEDTRCEDYLNWIYKRLIYSHLDANPEEFVEKTIKYVKDLVQTKDPSQDIGISELDRKGVFGRFYFKLPNSLRKKLNEDAEFLERIGVSSHKTTSLLGLTFPQDKFHKALVNVLNGNRIELNSSDGNTHYLEKGTSSTGHLFIDILDDDNKKTHEYFNPAIYALLERENLNIEQSDELRSYLDRPRLNWPQIMDEIWAIRDPLKRLEMVEELEQSSTKVFYSKLELTIQQGRSELDVTDMLAESIDGDARHFRIDPETNTVSLPRSDLEGVAKILLDEEGLHETTTRFVGLPVPIPEIILDELRELDENDLFALLHSILRTSLSPVSLFHVIKISHSCDQSGILARLASRLIRYASTDGFRHEYESFTTVLRWVENRMANRLSELETSVVERQIVLWFRTNSIWTIYRHRRVDPQLIQNVFGSVRLEAVGGLFDRDEVYWHDVLKPQNLSFESWLYSGLAYAISSDRQIQIEDSTKEMIKDSIVQRAEDQVIAKYGILQDSTTLVDSLGSFHSCAKKVLLHAIGIEDTIPTLSDTSRSDFIKSSFDLVRNTDSSLYGWRQLTIITGTHQLQEEWHEEMLNAATTVDCITMHKDSPEDAYFALTRIASHAVQTRSTKLMEQVTECLQGISEQLAKQGKSIEDYSDSLSKFTVHVLEIAAWLACVSEDRNHRAKKFAEIIEMVSAIYPASRSNMQNTLQNLYERTKVSESIEFLPSLLRLRAMP